MRKLEGITAVVSLTSLAILYLSVAARVLAKSKADPASLKDKSNEELLALVTGEKQPKTQSPEDFTGDRVRPSPLDEIWEMPAREAAIKFVSIYTSKDVTGVTLKIDTDAKPPSSGEIGMRWISGNYYAAPEQGLTLLKYDGNKSALLLSQVEIVGRPSKEEIESAVMKTDLHPIPRLVAQQTYEILWWLWHVRMVGERQGGQSLTSSSVDDFGRLWVKPDGPNIEEARFGDPCGECFAGYDDKLMYEAFVATLMRRLIERSGIKPRYPVPKVGTAFYPDDDARFLHTRSAERGEAEKEWIARLTEILKKPERQYLHDKTMELLVPIWDPLRYDDKRIDDALLNVLHRGLQAQSELKQLEGSRKDQDANGSSVDETDELARTREEKYEAMRAKQRKLSDARFAGFTAAEKLGMHDCTRAFPELFELAKKKADDLGDYNRPLIGAASIAARHENSRAKLVAYLEERLSYYDEQTSRGSPLLEAIWRADARSLAPKLEQIAELSTPDPNPNDCRPSAVSKARSILLTWRETDALTKTKLDVLLTGYIGGASYVPEVLRKEFAKLPSGDQLKVRQFITWMRTVDVGFSRYYLENAFTPHTPRPNIEFER
jgi:hypothetical protein